MEPPKAYEPKKVEDKIYKLWMRTGFFNPDQLPKSYKLKAKSYCIVLPPPNITGELHMGHALNTVIQDILIRQKRMQGFKTLWLPGTDHAGIATQHVVEKELKKEGKTRFDLGREKFIERIWAWREKYGNLILEQLKKMGASCDWSRTRFTLDKDYQKAVEAAFLHYYQKGWIYQGKRVVNWCPRCATSLSDLELEYREEKSHLWYIRYPLSKPYTLDAKPYIVVATTRPETMLGDAAVAVNPKDKRYKDLVGKKVVLPLVEREIPIVADRLVDPEFGTGAVKVTPAHDMADYEIGLRHNLKIIQVIGGDGKITKEAPPPYQGLKTLAARQKIVDDLRGQGLLEKIEEYLHQVPKCYRCNTTVELIPSKQWFLKMDKLAKTAIQAVKKGQVQFFPKKWEKLYFDWLKNVRDWCISRQIWWGHSLPIWHCQIGKKSKVKIQKSKLNKENYFISLEKPKKCPVCRKCTPKQTDNVLDTWFSAALWPFATLGWPRAKSRGDLEVFYPTDVLSTARDIINLWVARMIFSGMEFMGKAPFHTVLVHPTVLTKEGKRMSKSLGTGIDPINLIEKYGADATRFGIAYQLTGGQDIKFTEDNIIMGRKFCNKIWNASRFVLLQIGNPKSEIRNPKQIQNSKSQILKQLNKTIKSVNKDLNNYQFGRAAHTLYDFFWHDYCDCYIEQSKSKIQNPKSKKETQQTLLYILLTSLKLLHPFIPLITEEIYQKLPLKNKKKSLMVEQWPE